MFSSRKKNINHVEVYPMWPDQPERSRDNPENN